ncbi:CACTA en-spm transposon protein [Cucumis melo var. makuwa]|uniref:CACTA en-spm transposon protein n=1 Tax=Cucumis melo var. makuwa TaxID=1194695 RepID=A0A5A7V348_CUCMM|nr:CACTA en-spm transposon protein [Cucumis melo var. makuwa]TYK09876.1 CACTA en-spm transposon protein [Cucumis melo var. makuwa]
MADGDKRQHDGTDGGELWTAKALRFSLLPFPFVFSIISSFPSCFNETNEMFLEFTEDLNNIAGESSSMGGNSVETTQPSSNPRRRAQTQLLELEWYVRANGRIPMSIAPGTKKPISPQVVRFNQSIDVYVRKTFPVRYLRWVDVGREYIEVVKGDLQRFFVLDFNDQAMNRFIKHQMLTSFKEFRGDCHRHFKKYSDSEEARANPPHILKQSYNHSNGLKSFLQRQHELVEQRESNIGTPVPAYSIRFSVMSQGNHGVCKHMVVERSSPLPLLKSLSMPTVSPSLPLLHVDATTKVKTLLL